MNEQGWQLRPPKSSVDEDWLALRQRLWPETTRDEHLAEMRALMDKPGGVFVSLAVSAAGTVEGFAEATLRSDYVNGCTTSPVVFLEGIYVVPLARRQGIARALVTGVEQWARKMDCREFASDALLENENSHRMHVALGFDETERVVYFRKAVER